MIVITWEQSASATKGNTPIVYLPAVCDPIPLSACWHYVSLLMLAVLDYFPVTALLGPQITTFLLDPA